MSNEYEFHDDAFGEVFAEYEIRYDGRDLTVVDRIRVSASCSQCSARWTPEEETEFEACPNEADHEYAVEDRLNSLADRAESDPELGGDEYRELLASTLVEGFSVSTVLDGLVEIDSNRINHDTAVEVRDAIDAEWENEDSDLTAEDVKLTVATMFSVDGLEALAERLCEDLHETYAVKTTESYVEEYHFPDGRVVRAPYQPVIRCEHCGYEWGTSSESDRPSCAACHTKTDRNTVGKHYETYLKYALFTGEESSIEEVTERLNWFAEQFQLMVANGWQFDCTTRSSHVALSKGDAPQQDIIA